MAFDFTSFANNAMMVVVAILAVLFLAGLCVGGYLLWRQKQKYKQFRCIIWEKNGFGQLAQTYDWAGIFVDDKTKNKRLFMEKNNVGLSPDNVPYIPSDGGQRIIYLLKTGLKNFRYIRPEVHNPSIDLQVGEEDVNWAINAYERQKKMLQNNALLQWMPYITLVFTGLIVVILVYFLFQKFTVLGDISESLKEAAQSIAQAKAGTVVLGGS